MASHELVREERTTPRLGALVLEKWEPVVAPFGEIIAEEEEAASRGGERKTSAPRDAFEEGEGERIVVWVDEEAVKGKVREGMGIFGRFVWVGRDEEGEKGKGGFWFVDVVEALIAEVSRSVLFRRMCEGERTDSSGLGWGSDSTGLLLRV